MLISLHKQATTTPKIRAAIQASNEPAWLVAERYGISEQTVWKWRSRPPQEAVAVALRKALLLPLDDLLAVVREFLNPHASRSGLDRCLRRHGVGNLQALKPKEPKPTHGTFKAYEPGYLHIDIKYLPQMADEDRRRYLFVAIDRATRWVFVRIYPAQTAANARRFLRDLQRAAPMKITRVLTDNGKAFTDRLFGLRKRAATGQHGFDQLCAELGIEHRLTPPMHPQTNGMVERFNGRIEDVLQSHRFRSGEDLEQTLLRYVHLYNGQLPQSALKGRTPIAALKDWKRQRPDLFRKRVYNHAGCDSCRKRVCVRLAKGNNVTVKNGAGSGCPRARQKALSTLAVVLAACQTLHAAPAQVDFLPRCPDGAIVRKRVDLGLFPHRGRLQQVWCDHGIRAGKACSSQLHAIPKTTSARSLAEDTPVEQYPTAVKAEKSNYWYVRGPSQADPTLCPRNRQQPIGAASQHCHRFQSFSQYPLDSLGNLAY